MDIDRRSLLAASLVAGIAMPAKAQTPPPATASGQSPGLPQPAEMIDLWPPAASGAADPPLARAPGVRAAPLIETVTERSTDRLLTDRSVHGISRPRMAVFRPDRPNGAAVLLTPGGGYKWVVVDKEGYEMARWLSARGFTAFVLFYRLPGEGWAAGPDTPLIDAQRAIRLIRHRASDYAVDPERIAAMGFSAGGHVCASLSTRFAIPVYHPVDAADRLSAKPHCAAPLYPVISMDPAIAHPGSRRLLLGDSPSPEQIMACSPDRTVPRDAPPHFLLHAGDDDVVPIENTLRLHAALRAQKVPVEMHLFANGGHGFGLRKAAGKPVEVWPDLWRSWARAAGLG